MPVWISFGVKEAFHWGCVLDEERGAILSRGVQSTEWDFLEDCYDEMRDFGRRARLRCRPRGRTSDAAGRYGYGGEQKSARGDNRMIVGQLRMQQGSLGEVEAREDEAAEMRALTSYRKDLVGTSPPVLLG